MKRLILIVLRFFFELPVLIFHLKHIKKHKDTIPFEDRIATIKGIMNYNPKLGTLTVNTAYFPYTLSKDKNASLLIKKISSSWEIKKLSDGQLNIVHSGYMDPGGNIPSWVVNESITSGPVETLKGLKKRLLAYK